MGYGIPWVRRTLLVLLLVGAVVLFPAPSRASPIPPAARSRRAESSGTACSPGLIRRRLLVRCEVDRSAGRPDIRAFGHASGGNRGQPAALLDRFQLLDRGEAAALGVCLSLLLASGCPPIPDRAAAVTPRVCFRDGKVAEKRHLRRVTNREPAIRTEARRLARLPERGGDLAGMERLRAAARQHLHHGAEVTP
jgi:hypothetical protein